MKKQNSNRWMLGFIAFLVVLLLSFSIMYIIEKESARVKMSEIKKNEKRLVEFQQDALETTFKVIKGDINYLHDIFIASFRQNNNFDSISKNFQIYSKRRGVYDQIRVINTKGDEILRVNYNNGRSFLVPDVSLQNKSERYYFSEAITLEDGNFYVSPLDLNIEEGIIEMPYKPVVRISMPVYIDNNLEGVIVINYMADTFLETFKALGEDSSGQMFLINHQGDYLSHKNPAYEWQFMFDDSEGLNFKEQYSQEWTQILGGQGQFINKNGEFTFGSFSVRNTMIDDSYRDNSLTDKDETLWHIVSYVPFSSKEAEFIYNEPIKLSLYVLNENKIFFIFMMIIAFLIGFLTYLNRKSYHKVKYHSEVDHLTKLLNRRAGLNKLEDIVTKSNPKSFEMSLCYIDINGLKEVNDTLGHEKGDELIKSVAEGIERASRKDDFGIRLGGDEFLIAFINNDKVVSEKIWQRIHGFYDRINEEENRPYLISVSHGIVAYKHEKNMLIDDLIKMADELMYQEKRVIKKNIKVLRDNAD